MKKGYFCFSLMTLVITIFSFNIQPAGAQYPVIRAADPYFHTEPPDLEILGETNIAGGIPESYVLQATIMGTSFQMKPKWSTNLSGKYASISENGVLVTSDLGYEYEVEITAEIPWYNNSIFATQIVTISSAVFFSAAAKPKPVRLQKLTLTGPGSLENGKSFQFSLSAKYSNDPNPVDVTNMADWTVTPSSAATISTGLLTINNLDSKVKRVTVSASFVNPLNGKISFKKKAVKILSATPTPPPPTEPMQIVRWGFLPSSPITVGRNQNNVPIYGMIEFSDGTVKIISWEFSTQWISENTLIAWFPNRPGPTGGMLFTGNNSGRVKIGFRYLYQSIFYESQMWITVQ